ncbi:CHAT domain-containing protein, partial [bacterium]|nr:CHAT domain-containing protein [bacterium]
TYRTQLQERSRQATESGAKLYQALVAPAEKSLSEAKQLLIVADGALQLIPFGALQGKDGKYLAERFPLVYAPSLTLAFSGRADRGTAGKGAVVVAAPETGYGAEVTTSSGQVSDRPETGDRRSQNEAGDLTVVG